MHSDLTIAVQTREVTLTLPVIPVTHDSCLAPETITPD